MQSHVLHSAILSSKTVAEAERIWSSFVSTANDNFTFDLNNIFLVIGIYELFLFLRLDLWEIYTL